MKRVTAHPASSCEPDGVECGALQGVSMGGWIYDPGRRCLTRRGRSHLLNPKESGVLEHLLEAAPEVVGRDDLINRTWPRVVVGDHVLHEVIGRLRKILGDDARHPRYIETLTKRGYRLMVGVKALQTPRPPAARSVAVLPFTVSGPDPGLECYASGLQQELRDRIASYQELQTIVTEDSGAGCAPGAGGAPAHDAAYLIVGGVQRLGAHMRTRVQLVCASDRHVVWSATYTLPGNADPAESATAIGRFVRLQLIRDQQCQAVLRKSRSAEAAGLVCAAIGMNYRINQQGPFDPSLMRTQAERAALLDPNLLEAYQLLPTAYFFLSGFGQLSRREASRLSHAALNRALAIDPEDAYTLWSVGFIEAYLDLDYESGERNLRKAIANDPLHPNAHWFHASLGALARRVGDLFSALEHFRRAVRLNDSDARVQAEYAETSLFAGEYREAIRAADIARQLCPPAMPAWISARSRFHAHLALGERSQATRTLEEYLHCAEPEWRPYAASLLASLGRADEARRMVAAMESVPNALQYPLILARIALGELDQAFRHVERAVQKQDQIFLARCRVDPALEALLQESRWTAMMQILQRREAEARARRRAARVN